MLERFLTWGSRMILGLIFIYAGYTKLQSPLQFASAIESYRLLPTAGVLWIVDWLPWAEIVLGVLLLTTWKTHLVAGVVTALLIVFIGAMGLTYARGIEADCGCFGVGERISPFTLARDSLFLLPGFYLTLRRGSPRSPVPSAG